MRPPMPIPNGVTSTMPRRAAPICPILYSTVRAGGAGNLVAIGRDLRAMAGLQQRLVTAQQSMERDYARLRHVETRYRLLFQVTAEPVVIVDAGSHKVVEANPAAGQLLGEPVKRMVGHPFLDSFDPAALADVQTLLNGVQSTGRADNVRARLTESRRELLVYASLFRQENSSLFLVRLLPLSGDPNSVAVAKAKSRLLEVVESAPDGIVVTGPDGRILTANAAFLDLAQLATEEQARGESLERWLGRPGVDLNVLIANLRQHGSVRLFATILRGEYGASSEIEVSAVSLPNGEQPCFGFTIRGVGRRLPPESRLGSELPRSVEQLTELVGRVPLKDLVRETTDVIERLCIEAALELTARQPRLGRRDPRVEPAEPLRQAAALRAGRSRLGRGRCRLSRRDDGEETVVVRQELPGPFEMGQGTGIVRLQPPVRPAGGPVGGAEILEIAAGGVRHPDRHRQALVDATGCRG